MPTAGCPSAAAAATTSLMREAPSSIEYSVWRCRWTNESVRAPPSDLSSTGPVDRPVENHMSVITLPQVLGEAPESNLTSPSFPHQQLGRILHATRPFLHQQLG